MSIRSNKKCDVVFVGAGPVGLWTAVQTKLRCPEINIIILDKNKTYTRDNPLWIKPSSMQGCPSDPRLKGIVSELTKGKNVRTSLIEQKLSKLAKELGIGIQKGINLKEASTLQKKFPNAKVIVGSDGAHSFIRKKIFDNAMSVDQDLKFILDLKYEVTGKAKALNFIEAYPALKIMGAIVQETVGKEKEGKSPITVRVFIDKKHYEKMQDATFKEPYTFANADKIEADLQESLKLWLNNKKSQGEVRVPGSEKITVTRLGVYSSSSFYKVAEKIKYYLVGDAAFGVPFFRSLNNGLLCGTLLSKEISDSFSPGSKKFTTASQVPYSLYVKSLANREIFFAKVKSFFLDFVLLFVKISAKVPWQTNFWSEAKIRHLRTL